MKYLSELNKYRGSLGLNGPKAGLLFMLEGIRNQDQVKQLLGEKKSNALGRLLDARPSTLGVLVWPFICASWTARERLQSHIVHCDILDREFGMLDFEIGQSLVLADLSGYYPELRIILDKPKWFSREGLLAINLFLGNFRAYSLAFTFGMDAQGSIISYVGGIQGRNREDILSEYRSLTKKCFGLRPRDLLIEAFQALCRSLGIASILAVCDSERHHRHWYFGKGNLPSNYDDIWSDRGGVRENELFYRLPCDPQRREIDSIKSKKKKQYINRYLLLEQLEQQITKGLHSPDFIQFKDE